MLQIESQMKWTLNEKRVTALNKENTRQMKNINKFIHKRNAQEKTNKTKENQLHINTKCFIEQND